VRRKKEEERKKARKKKGVNAAGQAPLLFAWWLYFHFDISRQPVFFR
jgi:hypothetical protein